MLSLYDSERLTRIFATLKLARIDGRPVTEELVARLTVGWDTQVTPEELVEAIKDLERVYGDQTTIWLELVGNGEPTIVLEAVRKLAHFGVKLVVTHGAASSLEDGPSLSAELMAAVRVVQGYGEVYDPSKKAMVHPPRGYS